MAGIGFQLKKLIDKNRFFGGLRAYTYSLVIISGPMILCILQLIAAQYFLEISDAPFFERELLLSGSLYSFIFSQLITGGFIMVVTRYAADQIYQGTEENILSSLYGMMAVILLLGGLIGFVFYSFSPLNLLFKTFAYFFFVELLIINMLAMYISAVKKYMEIVKGFLFGVIITVIAMWLCFLIFHVLTAVYLLACMSLGFFVIILLLIRSIKKRFPANSQNYFGFLVYLRKYPSLFFVGLFYAIGLFGHSFIVWGSDRQIIVGDTYVMAPFYDVPIFYAYLAILPAMIKFVVSVETSFYKEYKNFYAKVLGTSSLQEITEAKSKMFHVLMRELIYIMEVQLVFTICAIALGTKILPLSIEQINIFNIVVIGNYFFIIMFVVMQILLYFDDRRGALMVMTSYVLAILPITTITVINENYYGFSCFIAGMFGLSIAFVRLYHYGNNLEYYTYCLQPMVLKEEKRFMDRMVEKLNSMNGVVKEK